MIYFWKIMGLFAFRYVLFFHNWIWGKNPTQQKKEGKSVQCHLYLATANELESIIRVGEILKSSIYLSIQCMQQTLCSAM